MMYFLKSIVALLPLVSLAAGVTLPEQLSVATESITQFKNLAELDKASQEPDAIRAIAELQEIMANPRSSFDDQLHFPTEMDSVPDIKKSLSNIKDTFNKGLKDGLNQLAQSLPGSFKTKFSASIKERLALYDKGDLGSAPTDVATGIVSLRKSGFFESPVKYSDPEVVKDVIVMLLPILKGGAELVLKSLGKGIAFAVSQIIKRVPRAKWLPELRDMLVKSLRSDTIAILEIARKSLVEHLPDVIIDAIAAATELGPIVKKVLVFLLGGITRTIVEAVVGGGIDKLVEYLRRIWNIPELFGFISSLFGLNDTAVAA